MGESRYDIGDSIRVTCTFTNLAGANTDPTAVKVTVKDPSAHETKYVYGTDPEVVKSATGIYYIDVTIDEQGRWWFRWDATGALTAAVEESVKIRANKVTQA